MIVLNESNSWWPMNWNIIFPGGGQAGPAVVPAHRRSYQSLICVSRLRCGELRRQIVVETIILTEQISPSYTDRYNDRWTERKYRQGTEQIL